MVHLFRVSEDSTKEFAKIAAHGELAVFHCRLGTVARQQRDRVRPLVRLVQLDIHREIGANEFFIALEDFGDEVGRTLRQFVEKIIGKFETILAVK